MINKVISHYKILEKLGGGGMGIVYKAEDAKLHRIVALKFLPPELTRDEEAKKRFIQEAEAASSLDHNNICVVHEIDEADGQMFICMNYYKGETLKKKIERGSLKIDDSIDIAIQISEGLKKAHEEGIIHRDIKPANIFITNDGVVKILDFGLAKLAGQTAMTKLGSTLGTAAYMSPEQAHGEDVDQRSDIFSLGSVLYEMITGLRAFRGELEAAILYSIMNETPEPPDKTKVHTGIQHIIYKALAKEKDKRYQHVDEILADLQSIRQQTLHTKESKKTKSKLPLLILAGMAVVIIIVLIYFFFLPKPAPSGERSIAVLPFVDMSPQKDQEYFCDGMTEDLINRLSNVGELKVPARTSVYTFKGKDFDIKEVGSKLSVETVLEGSVQKSGDRLRITAQLINVADGYHLWSEKYDRELKDVFAIQDEISSAIVNALKLKLSSQEIEKISERPIDNVKAYEYYLKASRQIARYDEKSLDSASVYLQTAIDIMGDNAVLYAGMASVYSQYANIGIRQEDYLGKAEEYTKKALALKPDLATALAELGYLSIYKDYPRNLHDSFRYYKKAFKADSNEIKSLHGLAHMYLLIGDQSSAYTFVKKMEYKDPLNPRLYTMRGYLSLYDCQFGPALEQLRLLYQIDPKSPLAQATYSSLLAYNGKLDEALAVVEQIGNAGSKNVMTVFSLALKYALLNDKKNALLLITPDIRKTCWRDLEWSYWMATGLSLAGAKEEALEWLENAIKRGYINYIFLKCDPFLNNIRGEERFGKLMEYAKYEWEHFKVPE